jgi:hypothetical protein
VDAVHAAGGGFQPVPIRTYPFVMPADLGSSRAAGPAPGAPVLVRIRVATVTRWIWIVVAILIVATFAAQLFREAVSANTVVNLFDSDQKLNFPTTAKLLLMLSSTLLFATVGLATVSRHDRVRWIGMSVIFGLLTLDEFTYMHQRLSDLMHEAFGTGGVLRFAWVLVYLPLVAVIAVVYLPFWRSLPSRLRYRLLAAALLFAGGSGGIEFAKSALYNDDHWSLSFGLTASLSDALELVGLAILVAILLEHLTTLARGVDLRLQAR